MYKGVEVPFADFTISHENEIIKLVSLRPNYIIFIGGREGV